MPVTTRKIRIGKPWEARGKFHDHLWNKKAGKTKRQVGQKKVGKR